MSSVTCQISISLDGFVAGPNQTLDDPLGEGGERLHEWAFAAERSADSEIAASFAEGIGGFVMGRKMFGGCAGPWDESWRGWWGEDPPYHMPVSVLTHHAREPLAMEGGTTSRGPAAVRMAGEAGCADGAAQPSRPVLGHEAVERRLLGAGHEDRTDDGPRPRDGQLAGRVDTTANT